MAQTSELVTENVKAGDYDAYLARPTQGENLPCVIVLHEVFGLNDNIRSIARRFANEGYVALAVDMFSKESNRTFCLMKTLVGGLLNSLKTSHMKGLDGAVSFLQAHPQVNSEQVGIIGFCMGGGYALAFAIHSQKVKASSVFYGANPRPLGAAIEACPIVGSYPDKDFTTGAGRKLDVLLTEHNRPHDIKIYPNTSHSFFNDQAKPYNPAAAADSWQRTLDFFRTHLPK